MIIAVQLIVAALLVAGNAYFTAAEFSLVSVRRAQVEPLALAGDRRAGTVLHALHELSAMMAVAQLGITVCSLGLGAVAEPAFSHLLHPLFDALGLHGPSVHVLAYVVALAVVSFAHMVFGEMVPKNLALALPMGASRWLAPPLVALERVLHPVVRVVNAAASGAVRLLGVTPRDEVDATANLEDLGHAVAESSQAGFLGRYEQRLLTDALRLGRRTVTDVLLTPDQLVTLPAGATAGDLERLAVRTGYSRFPVLDPATRRPVGYLHLKDALDLDDKDAPIPPTLLRPMVTMPSDTPLDDAVTAMRRGGAHLAGVTGAGDGAARGLITLEDALEELVGEVHDPAHATGPQPGPGSSPATTPPPHSARRTSSP